MRVNTNEDGDWRSFLKGLRWSEANTEEQILKLSQEIEVVELYEGMMNDVDSESIDRRNFEGKIILASTNKMCDDKSDH